MEEPMTIPSVDQPKPPNGKRGVKTVLSILAVVLLGGWVGFWINKTVIQIKPINGGTQNSTTPSPIISQNVRQEAVIASQSAFLATQESVASLSGALSILTINDTLVDPPAVELPLGFSDN
jgi:hypothetical protein